MKDPIIVTGCARSGSSMTAGIIHRCGAFGGMFSPNKDSFENLEVGPNVIEPYLTLCGADPRGQSPLPQGKCLFPVSNLSNKIRQMYQFQGFKEGPWFLKDNRLPLIWPILHKAFPEALWVIVRRRDKDVVNSCLQTGYMDAYRTKEDWRWKWLEFYKARIQEIRTCPGLESIEVWPSKYVCGDLSEIRMVLDWLGLKWNEKAVRGFVRPELWVEEVEAENG